MFHQFFGENMLRADVCNSVDELGQLLDHSGPVAAAERNAARIFNADHCFFVTNGTSTSNKMVWHANVAPNDIVVVDRNCHVSILHAITMTGAIPVFLPPRRNHLGVLGPIPLDEFRPESIPRRLEANPIARNAPNKKPRILTLTQSTYDGIAYNVEMLKQTLNNSIDVLHFDEAWLPHAAFHEFYKDMHAIGKDRPRPKQALIYATHSTHKLLAGLSQASQILVQESETRKLDRHIFNEAYLMHTSTSPQYAIIASCDVSAAMMESPGGTELVKDEYDKHGPLWRILREFCTQQPRYERVGLRNLCRQIHDTYKAHDVARVTTEMYLSDLQPAMKPSDAFACMAHREIDRVDIDNLEGRVTGVLLTPYPPGIPLLIPGERFNRTIVEYLKFARSFNEKFPGFDTDIHGLVEETDGARVRYFMDCVRQR